MTYIYRPVGKKKCCKHCSKWLSKKEIEKYGDYCFKCGEYIPNDVIQKCLLENGILSCERIKQLKSMKYRQYLKTPEWKSTRESAIKRAGNKCQVCNTRKKLNVHHRDYSRRGHERQEDLVVLCEDCHEIFHANRKIK